MAALSAVGCEPGAEETPEGPAREAPVRGGTAVLCVPSQPQSLDPLITPDQRASDLAPLLFTPLVRYGVDGGIEPLLARSWRWEDGRRRLVLRLRRDVVWHDGRPVTADDVAWTLEVASRPDHGYPEAADFDALEAAEVRDDSTVVVRFGEPFAAGVEPLAAVPILPRHRLGELDAEDFVRDDFHRSPVGSGPFRFSRRRSDGTLVFERFDGFPAGLGRVHLDRIAVRVIPETGSMAAELRQGGVDACIAGSGAAERLGGLRDAEITALRPAQVQALVLNTERPPLGDPRVRRAVSAALDRASIAAAVSLLARPAGTPLPEDSPRRVPGLVQPDDDPGLADSLLTAAGWTLPPDGDVRRSDARTRLSFPITAPPQLRDALTVVQANLRSVGIEVALRFMEPSAFFGRIVDPETRPAAMALGFQFQSLERPDLHGILHSTGTANLSGYAEPRVDSLLDVAAATVDPDTLREVYRQLQVAIRRDVPMVFTVYVPRVLAANPRLRGVEPAPNAPLAGVERWWVRGGAR